MMSRELLEIFAAKHVLEDFRERFVHEALKKPSKLQGRICHQMEMLFPAKCRDGENPFDSKDVCIPITGTGVDRFREYRWEEVERLATRGFGLLVVSPDGEKFFAETEAESGMPSVGYASGPLAG